jgi:tetratricopeptide (TPR) repeat protein
MCPYYTVKAAKKQSPLSKMLSIMSFYGIIYRMKAGILPKKLYTALAMAIALSFMLQLLPVTETIAAEKEEFKKDIQYKLDLAKSYMRQGRADANDSVYYDKAIAQYDEVLKEDPQNKDALAGLAAVRALKSAPAEPDSAPAAQQYKATAEDSLDLANSYMRQGLAATDSNFYFDKAIAQFEEALKASPGNREALAGLADIYMKKGDAVRSKEFFDKLAAIDPVYAARQKARADKGAIAQALADQPEAPKPVVAADTQYKLDLAKSYMQQGFADPEGAVYFDNALKKYEEILEESPGEKNAIKGLVTIYAQRGNFEEAERLLRKLVEAEPKDLSHRVNLGFFYYSKGMKDKALNEIVTVIAKDPRNGRARLLRAVIFEDSADLPSAIAEYETAIRIAKETKDAPLVAQAYIGLGRLYNKASLYFDAVLQFEKLASVMQGLPEAYIELSRIYFRLGLFDRAIAILTSLVNTNPKVPQAYVMLGLAYYKKGSYGKSLEYLKRAKAAGGAVTEQMLDAVEQKANEFWAKAGK